MSNNLQNIAMNLKNRAGKIRQTVASRRTGAKMQGQEFTLGEGQLIQKGKQLISEFRNREMRVKKLSLTPAEKMNFDLGEGRSPKAIVQNKIIDIMT